jgi:hypothetical protein
MTFKRNFEASGVAGYVEVAVRGNWPALAHPLQDDPEFQEALDKLAEAAKAAFERSETAVVMQALERKVRR